MTTMESSDREKLKRRVSTVIYEALVQICGGGLQFEGNKKSEEPGESWTTKLLTIAQTTVSFTNKNSASIDGKPHDIEIRSALTLFRRYTGRKRKQPGNKMTGLIVVSDSGLRRTVHSPKALADLLCSALEEPMREENLTYDVRSDSSGIICVVTPDRAQALRESGRLPCPQCVRWCKGEKGLWWHQQREHGSEHSVATAAAVSERTVLAIVPYGAQCALLHQSVASEGPVSQNRQTESDVVFELVKSGQLHALKQAIRDGFDPLESRDRNGASLLLWAAGSGHLDITRFLIETCRCSPDVPQNGKRSFSGRTALHWAARNGHLKVVRYLVETCNVDIDASTTDGTTAFCWASWKGHLSVMKFLHKSGADAQRSNSFGCNAVLWCAQGEGNVDMLKWLQSIGLSLTVTNSNGHGVLHKAAQRQRRDVCDWLCSSVYDKLLNCTNQDVTTAIFDMIGPDNDGCCPSDLAGMEGDEELAARIAQHERRLALLWYTQLLDGNNNGADSLQDDTGFNHGLPGWLSPKVALARDMSASDLEVWEPWGGVRRIQHGLRKQSSSS